MTKAPAATPRRALVLAPPRSSVAAFVPASVARGLVLRARSIAEALFATEEGPPPAARLDWLELELVDFLGRTGASARLLLGGCLLVVVLVAPLSIGRVGSLGRLSFADRHRALQRFERTPFAPALLACKAILCILYFEHPDAAREIGADGSCLGATR